MFIMVIKVLAAVLAGYECYKMLNADAFIKLIKKMKAGLEGQEEGPLIQQDPLLQRVFLIEVIYIIFAVALLFTEYWHFTLVLLSLNFLLFLMEATTGISSWVFAASSAIFALLLMNIVLF